MRGEKVLGVVLILGFSLNLVVGCGKTETSKDTTETELRNLKQWHEEGILTDDEYVAKKRKVLGLGPVIASREVASEPVTREPVASAPVTSKPVTGGPIAFSSDTWEIADDKGAESDWEFLPNGQLQESSNDKSGEGRKGPCYLYRAQEFKYFKATVDIINDDDDLVGMRFGYRDPDNFYQVRLDGQEEEGFLEMFKNGQWESLGRLKHSTMYNQGVKFQLGLEVTAEYVQVTVDGEEIIKAERVPIEKGKIGVISFKNGKEGVVFSNLKVTPL